MPLLSSEQILLDPPRVIDIAMMGALGDTGAARTGQPQVIAS
jgi:hypothetical protein